MQPYEVPLIQKKPATTVDIALSEVRENNLKQVVS